MVFLDHWKDRYLPDTLLLEVSCTAACLGWAGCCRCGCPLMGLSLPEESGALAEPCQGGPQVAHVGLLRRGVRVG